MNKRTSGIIFILLALGLIVYWVIDGAHIYTVEQVPVETVDELFGQTSTEWKDEYHPGLIPWIGAVSGLFLVLGGWLLWSGRRPKDNTTVVRV